MPFGTPITVKAAVDAISGNHFVLPSIQREVVWGEDRFVKLFDSLMRNYPINSFLFWKVPNTRKHDFQFYEFMRQYHERDFKHNPKANVDGLGDITAVLDGQQRLTALYIGLRSTYATKLPRKRRDDPTAYPKKELYLNVIAPISEKDRQEYGLLYDFRFLTESEAKEHDGETFWFKVGEILNFDEDKPAEIYKYLIRNGLGNNEFAAECLFRLHQAIHKDQVIIYFEEQEADLEKVLDIFVRINQLGVPLSHSDLLLSIATSQWQEKDARETIQTFVDELNHIGRGFNFNKDFVLKACLVLSDVDVAFRVKNFTKANMVKIERDWDTISSAIRTAVELVDSFGFSDETLMSNNAVIPLAYYLKKIGEDRSFVTHSRYLSDRKIIRNWFTLALLKRLFSGQSDSVLRVIRSAIQKADGRFPREGIEAELLKSLSLPMRFTNDEVDELLESEYGGRYTFLELSLLYPNLDYRNVFHQDHIFPRSFFTSGNKLSRMGISKEEQDYYLENYNSLPNLQLLEGPVNQEKRDKDFGEWLAAAFKDQEIRKDFMAKHYTPPDVGLSFEDFRLFYEARKRLLLKKLRNILVG